MLPILFGLVGFAVTRALFIGSAGLLSLFFGLNILACAAPLILALLGAAAAGGASGATLVSGFVSLALFGLALSLPLVLAVSFAPARRGLDWLAALSRRLPFWTGILFVAWVPGRFGSVSMFLSSCDRAMRSRSIAHRYRWRNLAPEAQRRLALDSWCAIGNGIREPI